MTGVCYPRTNSKNKKQAKVPTSRQLGAGRQLVQPPERFLFYTQINGRRLFDVSGLVAQTAPRLFIGKSPVDEIAQTPEPEPRKSSTEASGTIRLELDPAIENPPDQMGLFEKVPLAAKQALQLFVRVSQKPIKNNPGFYVRSDGIIVDGNNKPVKFYPNKSGYSTVYLKRKDRSTLVHRIVARVFVPNPEDKPVVDHINGVKNDNRASNLRWATQKENWHYWAKKEPEKARRAIHLIRAGAGA